MASPELDKWFRELHGLVESDDEDFESMISVADKILRKKPSDKDALRVKATANIQLGEFKKALQVFGHPHTKDYVFERAYCCYRLHDFSTCLELVRGASTDLRKQVLGLQHLEAQVSYRMQKFQDAAKIYKSLLSAGSSGNAEEVHELQTNALAAYVSSGRIDEAKSLAESKSTEEQYEVIYNLACGLLDAGELEPAKRKLELAEKVCTETLQADGCTEDEIREELAVIRVQQAYLAQLGGDEEKAAAVYTEVLQHKPADVAVRVAASNNLVCMRAKDEKLFDSLNRLERALKAPSHKLSAAQLRAVRFNQCVLLLHGKQLKKCAEALESVEKDYPKEEFPVLCRAALLIRENRREQAIKLLKGYVSSHKKSVQAQLALAHTYVSGKNLKAAIQQLQQISSMAYQPGMVATLVDLHDRNGNAKAGTVVLEDAVAHWEKQSKGLKGDEAQHAHDQLTMFMEKLASRAKSSASGRGSVAVEMKADDAASHAEALDMYTKLLEQAKASGDKAGQDKYLRSLVAAGADSGDLGVAQKYASQLPDVDVGGINVEELETKALPRVPRAAARKAEEKKKDDENKEVEANKKKKKKKKKRKPRYPKGFDPANPAATPKPDPERWLPRWERSTFKKRAKRRFKPRGGAQGHVPTDKEIEKLQQTQRTERSPKASVPAGRRKGRRKGR